MSLLKLYRPDSHDAEADAPPVVPFRAVSTAGSRFVSRDAARQMAVLQRSRVIHENRQCPDCHHPVVLPLELRDGVVNRNGMPVPGTATLVGFHCDRCDHEWPA